MGFVTSGRAAITSVGFIAYSPMRPAQRSPARPCSQTAVCTASRAGIWHKAGMVVVVCVAALTDLVLCVAMQNLPGFDLDVDGVVLPVVLVWYIFTELGSIAENAAAMGAPVPGWLIRILAQGKEGAEK